MSAPLPDPPSGEAAVPTPPNPATGDRGLLRFLYTQNPFYLLSVCFVLNGTSYWFREGAASRDPWLLMGLTGGYILMMAATAFIIVRAGAVWEDARSILLILLLLFVQLSLTFDRVLLEDSRTGAAVLTVGLVFCSLVTEGLLAGLRIRLPLLFRVPYHLALALLFLYPLVLVGVLKSARPETVTWWTLLFSPLAAGVVLALVPAVRRGAGYVAANGTPWHWPWFPWVVFVLLIAGLGVRTFALSLSFDPVLSVPLDDALRLPTAFDAWFLVPIILAAAAVVLEIGVVEGLPRVRAVGLAMPLLGLLLSFPAAASSVPRREFLTAVVETVGSPVLLTVAVSALFYAVAAVRRVRHADAGLIVSLLCLSVVQPTTVSWGTLSGPAPLSFLVLAAWQGFVGLRRRQSTRALLALLCLFVAARVAPWTQGDPGPLGEFLLLQGALLSILAVGALLDDWFARWLRLAGAALLVVACVLAIASAELFRPELPPALLLGYAAATVALAPVMARLAKTPLYYWSGAVNVAVFALAFSWDVYVRLRLRPEWPVVRSYLIGLALFLVAAGVSATKAGLTRRWFGRLARPGSS